jgi:hypothetical protein
MARTCERYANPTCGDNINLKLFVYNSNNLRDVESIEKIEIYYIEPTDGSRRLVETIQGDEVTQSDTGTYALTLALTSPTYTIGKYVDVWTVQFENTDCGTATIENPFVIYPDLWFTTPIPPVYDFNLTFSPNKIVKGSKRYLIIKITPNVPRGADIISYYENLAIVSDVRISMAIACGECVPAEEDLRLVIDRELVDHREKQFAYYFLDTTDLDEGIYDVWFELQYGENLYISEKNQLQLFK